VSTNFGRSAVWADLTNKLTNSSRNGLILRASKLQVIIVIYKLNLQLHLQVKFKNVPLLVHLSVVISDRICLTVILTVKFSI
jgi:hypothetical protein